jgi:signal transduction histidine kinase/DNA-binding response OmpR family regulator
MHRELSVSKKIKNENLQAWSMVNLGSVHSMTGSPDSAFHYYTLSLEIAEHIKDHDLMITVLDNIGSYYSEQKDYTRAKRFLNEAYTLAEETGYQYQNVYTSGHLAENYFAEGKFDSALYYAHKQLELATAFDFPYDRKLAYATLSKTYAARKDYARAYDAMVRHTVINDSLFSKEKSMQLESLREHYEAEKKDHAITLLRQQRQSDAFRRNVYVTAGLSALSILLLLYYRQRKAGSENLRLLLKEQELEKTKSRFFANISHEFRTPLTLILGPVHMLDENVEDPRLKLQIGIMQQNAKRLLSLTNQLLDLARLEAGQLKLQVIHGDIIPVVKGITQAFSSLAETRGITLDMNISEQDLPLYFDKEKIETVLTNLLSNAFKFTPDGGKIALTLSLSDRDDHTCCRITVRDTGIGIAPEDVGNVFNRFYQSATTHQGQYGGTGIGLALTKELVDLHGGSVAISSDEGVGTEVTVWLPLGREHFKEDTIIMAVPEPDLVSDDDVEIEGALHQPAVVPEHHPLLLLIEDNPDVMHYLKSILADRYRILEAANGDNGIRAAIEHIPDLIVSDVMMPGKDGYEVCATLKKNEKTSHVPLILLTAKTAVEDKLHGLESMAEDYLTKPFHPKELLVRVQNLIASRKQLREKFNRQLVLKPSEIAVSSVDEVFLRRVIKAIEDNLENEHFSIEQLGKDVGMSRSQIHRKLHALTNQSATQFIRSFRLTRAMDMIRQHAGSVSEIAYSVGFSSPSYFNRCFLQHFGCTPGEVKRSGEAG